MIIKQLFEIRDLRKLIWGLSFTASALLLIYTLLCLSGMEAEISLFVFFIPVIKTSKWFLLAVPILSVLLCAVLYWDSRRGSRTSLYLSRSAGSALILTIFCFLLAVSQQNVAKELATLPPLPLLLAAVAFAVYWIVMSVNLRRSKASAPQNQPFPPAKED